MRTSNLVALRLTPEQRKDAENKQRAYNLPSLSDLIRLALVKLRMPADKEAGK